MFGSGMDAGNAYGHPCTPADSVSGSTFDYSLCGLPDLDQVRKQTTTTPGLPGDGYSYCAPTATMDALAYFASHGIPALRPGDMDWTDPANYNAMSADIEALGGLMKTDLTGTAGANYDIGLGDWLAERQPGVLVPSYLWVTEGTATFAPTLQQMATDGAAGNVVIVNIMFAKYERPPRPASGPKQWFQLGGHVMAMSSAKSPNVIGVHDPATPITDHDYQAPYTQQTYTLKAVSSTFGYVDTSGNDQHYTATLLRMNKYVNDSLFPGAGTQAFISNYWFIQPERIITWTPAGLVQFSSVRPGKPVKVFATERSRPVGDLALDPTGARDFYTTQGSSTIWTLNTASGGSTAFAATGTQPQLLAFAGRSRTLFVSESGRLMAFDVSGTNVGSVAIPDPVNALAIEQSTDRVLALTAQSGQLRIFDSKLKLLGTVQLPQTLVASNGRVSIAVDNQIVYVHRDGATTVARVALPAKLTASSTPASVTFVQLAGGRGSKGLAVGGGGRIFVQNADGRLAEYLPSGKLMVRSPFNGETVGPRFVVNAAFSNADPRSLHFIIDHLPHPGAAVATSQANQR